MKLNKVCSVLLLTLLFDSAFAGGRIYGGFPVDITEVPYMAHITQYDIRPDGTHYHLCGGTILRPNLILTAAHCFRNEHTGEIWKPDSFEIRVGSNSSISGGVTHLAKEIHQHPKYNIDNLRHNDVAIIELVDDIKLDERSQLVKLACKNYKPKVGTKGIVSGWGTNPDHEKDNLRILYQVDLNVISAESCYEQLEYDSVEGLAKHEICAEAPGKNFCQGDSGGPFIDSTTNRQIGIVSYGWSDCTASTPSVFCKVTDNLDFITGIITKTRRADKKY